MKKTKTFKKWQYLPKLPPSDKIVDLALKTQKEPIRGYFGVLGWCRVKGSYEAKEQKVTGVYAWKKLDKLPPFKKSVKEKKPYTKRGSDILITLTVNSQEEQIGIKFIQEGLEKVSDKAKTLIVKQVETLNKEKGVLRNQVGEIVLRWGILR